MDTYGYTVVGDNYYIFVFGVYQFEVDYITRLFRQISRLNALSGSALERILGNIRTLAVAVFSKRKHLYAVLDLGHIHDRFAFGKFYRPHALARSAGGAHVAFGKADTFSARGSHEQFVIARGELRADKFVAFGERYGYLAVGLYALEFFKRGALDKTLFRRHRKVSGTSGGHGHVCVYLFAFFQGKHVYHGSSLARLCGFGYLPALYAVNLALVAEEEKGNVCIRGYYVFHKVLFLRLHRGNAHAAAALGAVFVHRHALDISVVGDGYHYIFLLDKVFYIKVGIVDGYFTAALIRVLVAYLAHFRLYNVYNALRICENVLEVGYQLFKFGKFRLQLFHFEGRQSLQPHIQNRVRLLFGKLEPVAEVYHRVRPVARLLQKFHHFVYVGKRFYKSEQYMFALLRLVQIVFGAAGYHVFLVLYIRFQNLFQIEYLRHSVHEREHYHRVAYLHLRMLEQQIEHNLRTYVLFDLYHYTHTFAVGLLVYVAYALYPLLFYKVGYAFNQLRLVHLVGNLRHYNAALSAGHILYFRARADNGVAFTRLVRLFNARSAHDERAGRVVGRGDIFYKLVYVHIGIVEQGNRAVYDFGKVVGRNGGGHTHRYTVGAVYEQIGIARRQHYRLVARIVEVGVEVHRLFLYVAQHFTRYSAQPCFRVTVSRGRVAVHTAEVAVSVNQRTAN